MDDDDGFKLDDLRSGRFFFFHTRATKNYGDYFNYESVNRSRRAFIMSHD